MSQNPDNEKLEVNKTKNNLNLFGGSDSESVNFKRYSFVTTTLILSVIYFIFTLLFIVIAGIIGIMVAYFLQKYNLTSQFLGFALWQRVTVLGAIVFLVANFCLFEAEAFVAKLIYTSEKQQKNDDLKAILKVRPKNWQKIFYSLVLLSISLLVGYLFTINYISWNYNQFWN
jgi:H+/Cl- antiporter ClcA